MSKNNIKITIDKAIQSIQHIASKKNIAIRLKNQQTIVLLYNEDRILQVLTNLLSNALKYCDSETGIIAIDYKRLAGYLRVRVKQNRGMYCF